MLTKFYETRRHHPYYICFHLMRIFLFLFSLLLPIQAFCAKNFFSEPSAEDVLQATLAITVCVMVCVFFNILYAKKKWKLLLIFNVLLHVAFCLVNLVMLLFSPLVCLLAYIIVGISFLMSVNHSTPSKPISHEPE